MLAFDFFDQPFGLLPPGLDLGVTDIPVYVGDDGFNASPVVKGQRLQHGLQCRIVQTQAADCVSLYVCQVDKPFYLFLEYPESFSARCFFQPGDMLIITDRFLKCPPPSGRLTLEGLFCRL